MKEIQKTRNKTDFFIFIPVSLTLFSVNFVVQRSLHDPVNLPKLITLVTCSYLLVPIIIFKFRRSLITNSFFRVTTVITTLYVITFLISGLLSTNLYNVLVGTYRRNNGVITLLSFVVIMLYLVTSYRRNFLVLFKLSSILVGIFHGIYGFVQILGFDPIKWNTMGFGGIFGTLGNSNFYSSTLAFCAVFTLHESLKQWRKNKVFASTLLIIFVLQFFLQIETRSQQGILYIILAIFLYLIITLKKNSRLKLIIIGASGLILAGVFLIITNIFKISIFDSSALQVRWNYWKTALDIFNDYPMLGVGTDRFGDYFSEYTSSSFLKLYPTGVWTDNAHGALVNILATQGLFTALLWILLFGYPVYIAAKNLKQHREDTNFTILFASYLSYLILMQFTIDSSFIGIWLWTMLGLIIGFLSNAGVGYREKNGEREIEPQSKSLNPLKWFGFVLVIIGIIPTIIFCQKGYQANYYFKALLNTPNDPMNSELAQQKRQVIQLVINSNSWESHYYFEGGYILAAGGDTGGAIDLINLGLKLNPRNTNGLVILAELYEGKKNYDLAISAREKVLQFAPYNEDNKKRLIKLKSVIKQTS